MKNQKQVITLPTEESPALVERVIALPPVIKVPLCLARDGRLAPWDWNIITALLVFANGEGWAWPSRRTLAAALGLPDDDWPRSFYARLKQFPQQRQNGKTLYHISPDPDGHCAWLPNSVCRYHLDSRGWQILVSSMYVCLSDVLSADPAHDLDGPVEIGPNHHQRILRAAGFDKNRFQRRYLFHALDQFTKLEWLKPGDYPGGYFLQLPAPISRVCVGIRQNPRDSSKSVHETAKIPPKGVHETAQVTECEPIFKNLLTYLGTESRPGSRPEQPEKRNGKKQEGGLVQGQPQSGSDSKDGFQRKGIPDAAIKPGPEVTERQKHLASQLAALNIVPVERLRRYLN